mmetsp:Transcript_44219/g.80890  ORF Transcript_44219/g.80890 Transcript_44219/m.80890 type:complete len:334 (+) Transcript_44219:1-1002(+)
MAAGVSTGWSPEEGGFMQLTQDVSRVIDDDVSEICVLLSSGKYTQLVYSAQPNNPEIIGTGIFEVCDTVKRYIPSKLHRAVQGIREESSFNAMWTPHELAEAVCDGLVKNGRVGLVRGTKRREDRIVSLVNLFYYCGLDGVKMSSLNVCTLEALWHAHANGDKWEASALSVLIGMLAKKTRKVNVSLAGPRTQSKQDCLADPDEVLQHLVAVQKRVCPKILEELNQYGRKRGHWIWWVFPTEVEGGCDPECTRVMRQTAPYLLKSEAAEDWLAVLEKLCDLVERRSSTHVVPSIDHGRIRYFLEFWKSLREKPDRMTTVLQRLDEFEWRSTDE